ncbi:MAG TPA: hypothetical protein VLN26_07395 [Gaiellaceae bacterium]|nr:hypothetical protein [Gaiellaceae bacterium]
MLAARTLLERAGSSRWEFDFWWLAPSIDDFDGQSPAEFIEGGGDPEDVLAAAQRRAEAVVDRRTSVSAE